MTTATRTKTAPHTLAVGDILYSSWGYSMTIVNWYQVIAVTPKMVTVAEIHSFIVDGDGMRGTSMPIPNAFVEKRYDWDEVKFSRLVKDDRYIQINESETARRWDGEPKYHDHWD